MISRLNEDIKGPYSLSSIEISFHSEDKASDKATRYDA